MGLFGGGGSSKAKVYNYSTVKVNPTTNIEVDTEEIANAIEKGAVLNAQIKKEENLLDAQELQQKQIQDSKKNFQILAFLILSGGSFWWYSQRKGEKSKK